MVWWPLRLLLGDGDAGFWSHCFLGTQMGCAGGVDAEDLSAGTLGIRLLGCGVNTAPLVCRPETPLHPPLCPVCTCVSNKTSSAALLSILDLSLGRPQIHVASEQHILTPLSGLSPSIYCSAPSRGTL